MNNEVVGFLVELLSLEISKEVVEFIVNVVVVFFEDEEKGDYVVVLFVEELVL